MAEHTKTHAKEPEVPEPVDVGCVVELKSGGCCMVVTKLSDSADGPFATCLWHDGQGCLKSDSIAAKFLVVVEPPASKNKALKAKTVE